MSVARRAGGALRLAFGAIAARPWIVLLFVAVQCASNLLRFWLGQVDALSDGASLMLGVGWLFLIARTFVTQWLHVAAARVVNDSAVGWRAAFAVTGRQAMWFHGLILIAMGTFLLRLWLSQASGGFFTPGRGLSDMRQMLLLVIGLAITYSAFLPLIPGYFTAILGPGEAPPLRWSLRAARGHVLPWVLVTTLLAMPPALLRRLMLGYLDEVGAAGIVATAALDAILTVLLMMLATSAYWLMYREATHGAPAAAAVPIAPEPAR